MAVLVEEIMNPEVFMLSSDESSHDALSYVLALGVSGAPVVDAGGNLIGMVSLRDLLADRKGDTIGERMTSPAVSVSRRSPISAAGKLMGETGYHRLAVTDEGGRLVGMLSTLDVVRGLLGMPAVHPATFPHYDPGTGVTWTDDHLLDFERVEAAPEGPGVIALVRGGAGTRDLIVWVEGTSDVRRRLIDLLALPDQQNLMLRKVLASRDLRFRAATVLDPGARERLISKMLGDMRKNFGAPN